MRRSASMVLVIILMTSTVTAFGGEKQDIFEFDGNSWRSWDVIQRASFISGFIAGTGYSAKNNLDSFIYVRSNAEYNNEKAAEIFSELIFMDKSKAIPKSKKPKYDIYDVSQIAEYISRAYNIGLSNYNIANITNGQIMDGLNIFYGDFKNRNIKLSDAIYVVRKQILGSSPEEIEAISQWLRSPDRDYTKRSYTDKDGKKKYATFPQ